MRYALSAALAATLLACGDARDEPADRTAADTAAEPASQTSPAPTLELVFTRDEQPFRVTRPLRDTTNRVEQALAALVRGPTAEERAAGVNSWFSATTYDAVESVRLEEDGRLVVDFRDLRQLIPNAASSAGSTMLLQELNGTLFQFPGVQRIEYRILGSCDAFWEWLQYDCQVVERPAA